MNFSIRIEGCFCLLFSDFEEEVKIVTHFLQEISLLSLGNSPYGSCS